MKTIFPDEIPEEMEDLREGTDSIEDSLKPILETDEKLRKLSESTSSTLGKLTASSSMLSAFQGYCMNSIFRGFGELAISNAIPKYSFTNPVLQQLKENYALNMAGMHTATSALGDYLHRNQEQFRSITDSLRAISESYGNAISNLVIQRFKDECVACAITISPDKVAVVTRNSIHSGNCVDNLWKTPETELLAKASFEWMTGNRKKAYSFCEKAVFQLTIKDSKDIDISIEQEISHIMPYSQWKQVVIEILVGLPSANEQCGQWVTNSRAIIQEILTAHGMILLNGATITDVIKIKTRDTQNSDFKKIPIKEYFEKKSQTDYTYSSVHGVKGETFDALMLLIHGTRGNTLTPSFLVNGNTDTELMRIAYVAMTRPRKLLVIAMPKSRADLSTRFPKDKWEYIEL